MLNLKKEILLPILVAIGLSSFAIADTYNNAVPEPYHPQESFSHFYIGAAYGMTDVEDDYFGYYYEHTEIDFDALMLQAGYEYNAYLAMEFRYWFSMGDGDYDLASGFIPPNGSYDEFNAWGLYLKPMYPVTNEFSIYGLLGFSGVYVDGEPGWDLLNESSFSWGLGASFYFTPNIGVFIDYVELYNDTFNSYYYYTPQDTSVDTINFGLSYKF
jgi:opacity protein-like surface antigen